METGALVYDGKDVPGTADADWNKPVSAGEKSPAMRLELLNLRAQAVGVSVPESNDLDDYERIVLEAERKSQSRKAVSVAPDMVTKVSVPPQNAGKAATATA